MRPNKSVAKQIVLAQIASDGGKSASNVRYWRKEWLEAYESPSWATFSLEEVEILEAEEKTEAKKVLISIDTTSEPRFARSGASVFGRGYAVKDAFIKNAIKAILRNKQSGFTFYVTRKNFVDSCGKNNTSFVVYFNFRVNSERYQISFHSFDKELEKYLGGPCPTRWKKSRNSRESAVVLANYILDNC